MSALFTNVDLFQPFSIQLIIIAGLDLFMSVYLIILGLLLFCTSTNVFCDGPILLISSLLAKLIVAWSSRALKSGKLVQLLATILSNNFVDSIESFGTCMFVDTSSRALGSQAFRALKQRGHIVVVLSVL